MNTIEEILKSKNKKSIYKNTYLIYNKTNKRKEVFMMIKMLENIGTVHTHTHTHYNLIDNNKSIFMLYL